MLAVGAEAHVRSPRSGVDPDRRLAVELELDRRDVAEPQGDRLDADAFLRELRAVHGREEEPLHEEHRLGLADERPRVAVRRGAVRLDDEAPPAALPDAQRGDVVARRVEDLDRGPVELEDDAARLRDARLEADDRTERARLGRRHDRDVGGETGDLLPRLVIGVAVGRPRALEDVLARVRRGERQLRLARRGTRVGAAPERADEAGRRHLRERGVDGVRLLVHGRGAGVERGGTVRLGDRRAVRRGRALGVDLPGDDLPGERVGRDVALELHERRGRGPRLGDAVVALDRHEERALVFGRSGRDARFEDQASRDGARQGERAHGDLLHHHCPGSHGTNAALHSMRQPRDHSATTTYDMTDAMRTLLIRARSASPPQSQRRSTRSLTESAASGNGPRATGTSRVVASWDTCSNRASTSRGRKRVSGA